MGLKAVLQNQVTKHVFSIERRDAKRRTIERRRIAQKAPHVVEYFHEVGDPYSHLMAQVLPEFCRRFEIDLKVRLVAPPPDWAAPDRQRLETYARIDAARLATRAGLDFVDPGTQPSIDQVQASNAALAVAVGEESFFDRAVEIGQTLWTGQASAPLADAAPLDQALAENATRRDSLGHYLGATLYYGGEWYWGLDRLHYLEARLEALGAARGGKRPPIFAPPQVATEGAPQRRGTGRRELHWYLSFRSPYTGIVVDRVKALADAYGADLKIRYVLPMVMRGMEVRRSKGFYIMGDVVREADRLGVPFGNVFDPVGKPVERGYAILHRAIELGKGFEFARSFLSGVWADGLDAGSDRGLKTITERAGLSWTEMKPLLGGDHWRADEDVNQSEMLRFDIWGVPSFRVGNVAVWGQDRLWVVEDALKAPMASDLTDMRGE